MVTALPMFGAALLSLGCTPQDSQSDATSMVPGPEATDLVARSRGWIALTLPVGGIQTVHLPALSAQTPRASDSGLLPVHNLSGPDALGRIAFVETDIVKERHALRCLHPDGRSTLVFEGRGDALWGHAVGKYLALDAKGARIALVARAKGVEFRDPGAYVLEGELEIWNVDDRRREPTVVPACDDVLSWFPDGKRLLYTALVPAEEAGQLLRAQVGPEEDFGRATERWERVPVVHVLEVDTGVSRALHVGQRAIVAPDGRLAVLCDFDHRWRILDLESGRSRHFQAAGAVEPGPIAFVDPDTVLYWASPTEGSELRYTENNSPLVGKKPMRSLKLIDLRHGRFQTAVPFVDPRRSVSFGSPAP